MREFTKSPLFLKIVSLACAIILWVYVIQVENPNISIVVSNVPIRYVNQEVMEQNNLMFVSETQEHITVTVQGRRKSVSGLNADNVSATVDLKNVTAAHEYTLPVSVTFPTDGVSVSNYEDMYITFEADVKTQVTKSVNVVLTGALPENYMTGDPVATPDSVTVTGPAKILETIVSAQADLDVSDQQADIEAEVPLQLIDTYGRVVKSPFVTIDRDVANVKCAVYQIKEVPVYVDVISYENGTEKIEKNYNVLPSKIKIAGTSQNIEGINEICAGRVYAADLGNRDAVSMDLKLTEGVINVDDIHSVELVLKDDAAISREFTLNHFEMKNLGYNIKSELIDTELTFRATGKKDALSDLKANDFTAQLDLAGLDAGVYDVPVTIHCNKEGISVPKTYTLKIKLTSSI